MFQRQLRMLLQATRDAARLGSAAHARVGERYLGVRHLLQYADLIIF